MSLLSPKKTKFAKVRKGRLRRVTKGGAILAFGEYGLKSLDGARVTSRQIEASRKVLTRYVKKQGKLWLRIFPDVPVTKKPNETRMGKGKGSVDRFVCKVSPGRILFEVDGILDVEAFEAFRLVSAKLPIRTKVVNRYE